MTAVELESALDAEARVLALMEEYADRTGLALSTVSRKCSGSGGTVKRMVGKGSITGSRLLKMVGWFRANWREEWPEPQWPVAFELSESALERILFAQICERTAIPLPAQQFHFAIGRDYRADFTWPDHRLLVEVEGGLWIGGKHAIALHEQRRQRRRCYAQALGWSIVEVSPPDVRSGVACDLIERWLTDPAGVCQLLDKLDADDSAEEAL